ncbi:trypsin-like serine peptidase [Streptomyces monticola]|uniref:Trypsin-like serine peptidase n=1 Tax=Streptomyces monticola TaxID=2666263 RepID=A0ABW2JAQ9_9ACTN
MRRTPWVRAVVLGICASIACTAPAAAAPSADGRSATRDEIREARKAESYWTPERIRGAVSVDAVDGGAKKETGTAPGTETHEPGARGKRSLRAPSHPTTEGIPTVGVFLIRGGDGEATADQFCSASAVASPTKSLVVTAAHCLKGGRGARDIAFVPGYRAGASKAGQVGETPYGIFPMKPGKLWIDGRYLRAAPDDDVDFAFLRVGPNSRGQLLEEATGPGNTLTAVDSAHLARAKVTIAGYPGGQKTPLQCTNDTTAFQGRFMEIKCDGFRAGVSGGPFLENFDGRRGDLVGVIGGYKTGGLYDHTSYTSQFDDDVSRLYRQAVTDTTPDTGGGLGDARTWQLARAMTAGRFHPEGAGGPHSDLVVRWLDGEVSLYPGDGKFGFGKEIRLIGPNETWKKYADVITAGDFTGTGTSDLLVRWYDGELTLYKDVDATTKLRNEIRLLPPNRLWKNAKGITAGRFTGAGTRADDLVVRWSDGEVTLYPDVDTKGTHSERRLAAPNKTWTYARDIAAGSFGPASGTGQSRTGQGAAGQDLFVRWADGEVSVYGDIGAGALKSEHRLRAPGSAWRQATLTTVGAFGGGGREDDLLTRWSTGKLAVNADTTYTSLDRERTLVPNPTS